MRVSIGKPRKMCHLRLLDPDQVAAHRHGEGGARRHPGIFRYEHRCCSLLDCHTRSAFAMTKGDAAPSRHPGLVPGSKLMILFWTLRSSRRVTMEGFSGWQRLEAAPVWQEVLESCESCVRDRDPQGGDARVSCRIISRRGSVALGDFRPSAIEPDPALYNGYLFGSRVKPGMTGLCLFGMT